MAEAEQLGQALPSVLKEISVLVPTVNTVLENAISSSKYDRTRQQLADTRDKHNLLVRRTLDHSKDADKIKARFDSTKIDDLLVELRVRVARVDPKKLEDEDLLLQCNRARATILAAPEVWELHISTVYIAVFSVPYVHVNLLRAYLGRPPMTEAVFLNAAKLVGAVALDVAGSFAPFLGVLEAVFKMTNPIIERDIERMREATVTLDRLFRFDDSLTVMLENGRVVESAIQLANNATIAHVAKCERDSQWLFETLTAAERQ